MTSSPIRVLVTRPTHQAEHLCERLVANGFQPVRYPTIEIQPVKEITLTKKTLSQTHRFQYIIFISANAVIHANKIHPLSQITPPTQVVAIGPKTAETLEKNGLTPDTISAQPFNSEQLLKKLPRGLVPQNCLIIKGEQGREFLAQELTKAGFSVKTIDVYKRTLPTQQQPLSSSSVPYITITSQLALKNLRILQQVNWRQFQQHSRFIVFSQRIADAAKQLGCKHIIVSNQANDEGLITALKLSQPSQ